MTPLEISINYLRQVWERRKKRVYEGSMDFYIFIIIIIA